SAIASWVPTPSRVAGSIWSLRKAMLVGGLPEIATYFNGGLGDEIMRTAVARELQKRGTRKIWHFASNPELFADNPDLISLRNSSPLPRPCMLAGVPCIQANSPENPPRHLIAMMCETAGIHGRVDLRPYVFLTEESRKAGKLVPRPQIVMQTSSL